jgi:hypothetical protein
MMPPAPQAPPPAAVPPPGPRTLTEEQQDAMEVGPEQMTPDQTDQLYRAAGAAQSRAGVPLEPAPAPVTGGGNIGAIGEGASAKLVDTRTGLPPSAAGEAPAAAPDPGIQTHDEMTSALSLFQRSDPSAWVKRIKEARPDAPDDVVWDAVERLNKMASGNIREQLAAASMIKFLKGEEGKNQRFQQAEDRRVGQLEVNRGNLAERQKTGQRLSAQFQERIRQFNSRLEQAKATVNATAKRVALNDLIRDINSQLKPAFGQPPLSDEEKAALMRQREEIVNTLRGISGMQPLPAAPAPAPAQ